MFREFLANAGLDRVGYRDWIKIDRAEIEAAEYPAPRKKFVAVQDMLGVLDNAEKR